MYAGWPFTVTLTPSRLVGNWLFTKSGLCQMRVSPAGPRLEPLISIHEFGPIVATPPSAFATSVTVGAAVVRGSGARPMGDPGPPKIEEWGAIWPVLTLIVAMPEPVPA